MFEEYFTYPHDDECINNGPYILAYQVGDIVHIKRWIVPKDERGNGLGGELFHELCDWTTMRDGVGRMTVYVSPANTDRERCEAVLGHYGFESWGDNEEGYFIKYLE